MDTSSGAASTDATSTGITLQDESQPGGKTLYLVTLYVLQKKYNFNNKF